MKSGTRLEAPPGPAAARAGEAAEKLMTDAVRRGRRPAAAHACRDGNWVPRGAPLSRAACVPRDQCFWIAPMVKAATKNLGATKGQVGSRAVPSSRGGGILSTQGTPRCVLRHAIMAMIRACGSALGEVDRRREEV
jgi:hypothetical protein